MKGEAPRRVNFFAWGVVTRSKQGTKTGWEMGETVVVKSEEVVQPELLLVPVT